MSVTDEQVEAALGIWFEGGKGATSQVLMHRVLETRAASAREEEREACAKIAEREIYGWRGRNIATIIRARQS